MRVALTILYTSRRFVLDDNPLIDTTSVASTMLRLLLLFARVRFCGGGSLGL